MMNEWLSVKDVLPLNDSIIEVRMCILWETFKEALFIKKYFVHRGENITKWVTHWRDINGRQDKSPEALQQ